jgi:hypothetical protein
MRKLKLRAAILIEISVATGILLIGLTAIFLTFTQVTKGSARNRETSIALNVLATQTQTDSQIAYDLVNPSYPVIGTITSLPNATMERQVTEDSQKSIKHIRYILQWQGAAGPRTIQTEYELVPTGLANDD